MLKKEARILGLSATTGKAQRTVVVGVVYRGRFWLDGMLTCSLEQARRDENSRISKAIRSSRQYSQLHAVILSRRRFLRSRDVDTGDLARRLKLPVIALVSHSNFGIKTCKKLVKANQFDLAVNGRHVSVLASQASLDFVQDVFSVACAPNEVIPEAVRVADLMAEQVTLR